MSTMQSVEELRDEVMALRFAFMTIARALHQRQALPIPILVEHLQAVAEQMGMPDAGSASSSLDGVAVQIDQLCAGIAQLQ